MMVIELPDQRKRGRSKRRFMGVVKEDMIALGVAKDTVLSLDRVEWKNKIRCDDP